jgi:hypothetical protein
MEQSNTVTEEERRVKLKGGERVKGERQWG